MHDEIAKREMLGQTERRFGLRERGLAPGLVTGRIGKRPDPASALEAFDDRLVYNLK